MEFVETAVFTRRIQAMGLEDELRGLQGELLENPEKAPVEPGTGGLRKIRMAHHGQGKRGGARVHYLALSHRNRIYLMFVYEKTEQAVLTKAQRQLLKSAVEEIKRTG